METANNTIVGLKRVIDTSLTLISNLARTVTSMKKTLDETRQLVQSVVNHLVAAPAEGDDGGLTVKQKVQVRTKFF